MIVAATTTMRRKLLLAPVLAVHTAVIVWFAVNATVPAPHAHETILTSFAIALPSPPATPVAHVEPKPVAKPLKLTWTEPVIAIQPITLPTLASLGTTSADACDLTAPLQQALLASADARRALITLPQSARSVANAVMLWNGGWIASADPMTQQTFTRINALVAAVVREAPLSCRLAEQVGPRLITIPGPPDIVLVLGSGRWRWNDVAPDDPVPPSAMEIARDSRPTPPIPTAQATGL